MSSFFQPPSNNNNTTGSGNALAGGGIFGNASGGGSTATQPLGGGGIFGGGNNASAAPTTGGGLFGGSKPASGGLFGGVSLDSSTGSTPAIGGGLFGSAPKPAESTSSIPATGTNPAPGGSLFGGGGGFFGTKKPEDQAASSTNATSGASTAPKTLFGNTDPGTSKDTSAPAGGLFGGFGGASAAGKAPEKPTASLGLFGGNKDSSTEKKDAAPALAPLNIFGGSSTAPTEKKDTPAASSFGLFGAPKDTEKKDSAGLGLGQPSTSKEGDKPKDVTGALTTTNVAAPNISIQPPSMLRGKTIEEIVNRWSSDLETHVREFNKFAGEVAVWDRALIENGNNLAALYSHVLAAEREQNDIDQSLDHIEQQQQDLSATLDAYEKSTEEILGGQGGSLRALDTGPADNERDKNYMLATELHTHLDDLSGSLTQMIDSVNTLSLSSPGSGDSKSQQGEDPMGQIAQILSSHLESLQWIDGAVREVEGKVTDVERGVREAGGGSSLGGGKSRGFGLNR